MNAISIIPHTPRIALTEVPEPQIQAADQIKMKVLEVGICGTDREEAKGGRADAPEGKQRLVIGHEMFGQVVATGSAVRSVKAGDYGMFTVRRGCGQCAACLHDRSDLCYTGRYTERGIKGADGFQTEYVVDSQQYFIPIPAVIKHIGVLTEPMSVAAKAIDEALIIQEARLRSIVQTGNWLEGKRALVAGLGPIGLMAAVALRLQGALVQGLDVVDENNLRVQLLQQTGGQYIDGRKVAASDIDEACGEADFIFEATGIATLQLQLIDALAVNGIYVMTGIPADHRTRPVAAGDIMQQLVLRNQVLLGSVNAGMAHYKMAVQYLESADKKWPGTVEKVITERLPYTRFREALLSHPANAIKVVLAWT